MSAPTIAIIGAGNMGTALIGGLIKDNYPSEKIWATDQNADKLTTLRAQFNINITTDNLIAAKNAEVILLAVKPHIFPAIVPPLADSLANSIEINKPLIVSIAAGVRIDSLQSWLKGGMPIVRAMPNTPALIGQGATALYANSLVNEGQRNLVQNLLRSLGLVVWLKNESLMDVVTALSGCGPAYFFLMMECLETVALEMGLEAELAHKLTLQTAFGAAAMAINSAIPLAELRSNVTSKDGATEKAIDVLEHHDILSLFRKALQAAKIRSLELANQMGK